MDSILSYVPSMKLYIVNLFVSFTEREPVTGCNIGPITISGLMTTRSKPGLSDSMNFHAACSASFFEALYPRTASWVFVASSAVTYTLGQLYVIQRSPSNNVPTGFQSASV